MRCFVFYKGRRTLANAKKRKFERKQEILEKKDVDITTTRIFFFAVSHFGKAEICAYAGPVHSINSNLADWPTSPLSLSHIKHRLRKILPSFLLPLVFNYQESGI